MDEKRKFYVLTWNFNKDMVEYYDVLPFLRSKVEESIEKENDDTYYLKTPKSINDFKNFIQYVSRHRFWSQCEYEMIIHGWPTKKNEYKIDIHEQIMMNINVISGILFDEYHNQIDKE